MFGRENNRPHIARTRAARHALAGLFAAAFIMTLPLLAQSPEETFMHETATAMNRMMRGMSQKSSGNVDVDFVNMMEPHHQGAIDMAILELHFGKNEQLRRIAQEIIVDQQQEIGAMRMALGRPLPSRAPVPTSGAPAPASGQAAMSGMTMH